MSFSIEEIREVRRDLSGLMDAIKKLNPSREVSLAYTNVQRGKSWLGKVLQAAGMKDPYPQSDNPDSKEIEPQADMPKNMEDFLKTFQGVPETQVAYVKFLRSLVRIPNQMARTQLGELRVNMGAFEHSDWMMQYLFAAILAIEEARMWLGWELDRIRESQEPKSEIMRKELPLS